MAFTFTDRKPLPCDPVSADRVVTDQSPKMPNATIQARVIRATLWIFSGTASVQILRFGSNILLARLLVPADFGIIALIWALLTGIQMLSDAGIHGSIIYHHQGENDKFLNTAWTVKIIRGFILWMLACALAWPFAVINNEPRLLSLIPVLGLTVVINGFASTSIHTHERKIILGRLVVLDMGARTSMIIAMIIFALISPTVWALAIGGLIEALTRTISSHIWLDRRPHRLSWNSEARKDLFSYGKWVFLSSSSTFLSHRADRIILSLLTTFSTLGIYSIASSFAAFPREIINRCAAAILQPAISELNRTDPDAFSTGFFRARQAMLAAGISGAITTVVLSPYIFNLLYPIEYAPAGWIAQILAIQIWIDILAMPADKALFGRGESRSPALANTIQAIVSIPACIFGFLYAGVLGFILGRVLGILLGHVLKSLKLWREGIQFAGSDILYTCYFAFCFVLAVGVPNLLPQTIGGGHARVVQIVCASTAMLCAFVPLALVRKGITKAVFHQNSE